MGNDTKQAVDLGFGTLEVLTDQICEVIINEGVCMDLTDVQVYHKALEGLFDGPFGLLINKVNKYTYTFEAQQQLASLPQIRAMAVLVKSTSSEMVTNNLVSIPRPVSWNIKIFNVRNTAMKWLEENLRQAEMPGSGT